MLPGNLGREVTFPKFAVGELLMVATGSFADDAFRAEARKSSKCVFLAFVQLFLILGFHTSPKKGQPPAPE